MAELKNIIPSSENLFQSPFLDLETAGSTGKDGSTKGIHLRWFLGGALGENHIPKGNLTLDSRFSTSAGFSRTDDFVKVFKVPYKTKFPVSINLLNDPIERIDFGRRAWIFKK